MIPLDSVADIAFSDDRVWVASGSSAHPVVYQIDPDTNFQEISMPVPGDPEEIVIAEGVAWVIGGGAKPGTPGPRRVARFDADTGARLPSVTLPSAPVRIRSGLGALWVSTSDPDEGAVYRIDPRSLATTKVPRAHSVVAVGPDSLWVTIDNASTGIHRIDPGSGRVLATVPVPEVRRLAFGAGALWALTGSTLYRLDPNTAQVVGEPVALQDPWFALVVGEDAIWVGEHNLAATIARLDPTP